MCFAVLCVAVQVKGLHASAAEAAVRAVKQAEEAVAQEKRAATIETIAANHLAVPEVQWVGSGATDAEVHAGFCIKDNGRVYISCTFACMVVQGVRVHMKNGRYNTING